jgi:hypothetical protein
MKKEYIIPNSIVVDMDCSKMMAASLDAVEYTEEEFVDNTIEALGRENRFKPIWDSGW